MDSGVAALEEHFVVRFPLPVARRIRSEFLAPKEAGSPPTLELVFSDQRHARVSLGAQLELPAVLVDLPTICETLRTTDASQYVKVCDLSRMLLVLDEQTYPAIEENLRRCGWQWPNGLAPPLVGVGKLRRTIKTAKLESAEKQVQRLLDADALAQKVSYALYQGDRLIKQGGDGVEDVEVSEENVTLEGDFEDEDQFFEEVEGEFAAELEDSLEAAPSLRTSVEGEGAAKADDLDSMHLQLEAKRAQAASMSNPLIRARLQGAIADLESDLRVKQQKLQGRHKPT